MTHGAARSMSGRLVGAIALCAGLIGSAQAAQVTEGTFDRTLKVTGQVDLEIRTGSGDIKVLPGASGSVRVVGKIHAEQGWFSLSNPADRVKELERNPPIDQQGTLIRIGVGADRDLMRNISISYEVTVPADTKLRSRTGSGDQEIDGIKGPLEAESGSGRLRVGRIAGNVEVSAGSGDIEVAEAASVTGHAGSGSIQVKGVAGRVDVNTGSGDITIAQTAPGEVDVSAASGDVTVTGVRGPVRAHSASGTVRLQGTPSGPWAVRTSSGDVDLELPADAAFELDAQTSSGAITSAHPVTMSGTLNRRELAGKVRGGGPRIEVHTASGDIRLK